MVILEICLCKFVFVKFVDWMFMNLVLIVILFDLCLVIIWLNFLNIFVVKRGCSVLWLFEVNDVIIILYVIFVFDKNLFGVKDWFMDWSFNSFLDNFDFLGVNCVMVVFCFLVFFWKFFCVWFGNEMILLFFWEGLILFCFGCFRGCWCLFLVCWLSVFLSC